HDELDALGNLSGIRRGDRNLDRIAPSGPGESGPGKGQPVGAGTADARRVGRAAHVPANAAEAADYSAREIFRVQRHSVGGEIVHGDVGTEYEPVVLVHDVHGQAAGNERPRTAASRAASGAGEQRYR